MHKDIFGENYQDFDGNSRTLTNFIAFEEYIYIYIWPTKSISVLQTVAKSLVDGTVQFAIPCTVCMRRIGRASHQGKIFSQRMNKHISLSYM